RSVLLRGDTDFSQTQHLDRWDADGRITFIFGYDVRPNLVALARQLPENAWQKLQRPPRYQAVTGLRYRPVNVKDRIVRERGFETLRLQSEEVAEFRYRSCQFSDVEKVWKLAQLRGGRFDTLSAWMPLSNSRRACVRDGSIWSVCSTSWRPSSGKSRRCSGN